MIARIWHGKLPEEKAEAYHQYFLKTGLKDYSSVNGNKGIFLLRKNENGTTHYYTLTFWDDYDAIREFAGEDYEKAKYYPEDKNFFLELEPFVTHFEVLEKSGNFW